MQSAVWLIGFELFTWFMFQLDSFLSPCISQRKTNDAVFSVHEKMVLLSQFILLEPRCWKACHSFLVKLSVKPSLESVAIPSI